MKGGVCSVEVPGKISSVRGVERVVEALGGREGIAAAWSAPLDRPLTLKLDPDDPRSRYVLGSSVPFANGAVVAVRRLRVKRRVRVVRGGDVASRWEGGSDKSDDFRPSSSAVAPDASRIDKDDDDDHATSARQCGAVDGGNSEIAVAVCRVMSADSDPGVVRFPPQPPQSKIGEVKERVFRVEVKRSVGSICDQRVVSSSSAAAADEGQPVEGNCSTTATTIGDPHRPRSEELEKDFQPSEGCHHSLEMSSPSSSASERVEHIEYLEFRWLGEASTCFRMKGLADFYCAPPRGDGDFFRRRCAMQRDCDTLAAATRGGRESAAAAGDLGGGLGGGERLREMVKEEEVEEQEGGGVYRLDDEKQDANGGSEGATNALLDGNTRDSTSELFDTFFVPPTVFTRFSTTFPYKYQDNPFASHAKYQICDPTEKVPPREASKSVKPDSSDNRQQPPPAAETSSSNAGGSSPAAVVAEAAAGPSAVAAGSKGVMRMRRYGGEDAMNPIAKFTDPVLPYQPTAYAAARFLPDPELLAEVEAAFAEKPLWLRSMLELRLSKKFNSWRRKAVFARTCFVFLNGPWRGCMCRFGYEPRALSQRDSSKALQTIDFRDPLFRTVGWRTGSVASKAHRHGGGPSNSSSSGGALGGPSTSSSSAAIVTTATSSSSAGGDAGMTAAEEFALRVLTFRERPRRPSQIYQLSEIAHPAIQKLIREAPMTDVCTAESGWFSPGVLQRVRELMIIQSSHMKGRDDDALQLPS